MVKINEMNETRRSSSRIKTIKSNKGAVRQRKKEEALDAAMKKPAKTQQRVKDTHGDVSAGAAVGKVYAEGKGAGRGANMSSYTRVKDTIRSFYKYFLQFVQMSADVARGHNDDGGGDDRPPPYQVPTGCGGCLGNRGKGTRKPNLGGRRAGRLHTRQETRNLGLKAITDKSGPVPIRFEVNDRETLMPLGDHAAHWANYLGELVRELPLHYPSWRQMSPEQKAGVVAKIGTQFDLRPHMESDRWPQIYAGIQQHLQKIYNGKKAALKERYWVPEEDGTYDLERLRRGRPSYISEVNWDAQLAFWNDPKNLARAAQNKQNRAKSKVMETSATREYPSLIHTFFLTHTVGGVFLNPEDKALYDEMLRLQGLGSNTPTGVPYTEDEIMAIVRGGKQRGHIPGVGRVLPGQGTVIPPPSQSTHSTDIARLKKREKQLTKQVNMFMRLFRSDDKFSQMLNQ
ncbi:hypothetical protein Tco_1317694 [Tanacetum coccineum]